MLGYKNRIKNLVFSEDKNLVFSKGQKSKDVKNYEQTVYNSFLYSIEKFF